jgi:hypothetical protein
LIGKMAGKDANMLSSAMRSSMLPMWSLLMALEITGGALAAAAAVAPDGAAANDGFVCFACATGANLTAGGGVAEFTLLSSILYKGARE